jgi:hypothetical protein
MYRRFNVELTPIASLFSVSQDHLAPQHIERSRDESRRNFGTFL